MDSSDHPEDMDNVDFDVTNEEEIFSSDFGQNVEDSAFDITIGVLQNILMDPEFVAIQTEFCTEHCEIFDSATENKLIYTALFEQYTLLIENFLEQRLSEEIPQFSMDEFCQHMAEHEDEIPLDVVDVLLSCSDFMEFKLLMLSFKQNEMSDFQIRGEQLLSCEE